MRPLLPRIDSCGNNLCDTSPSKTQGKEKRSEESELRIPVTHGSPESGSGVESQGGTKDKPKRIVVSNACVPCRKRRSKCDGTLPCAKCASLDRAGDCHFDAENDHRRKGALRRENETLKRKNSILNEELKRKNANLDVIFRSLANSEDVELENIVKRIRRGVSSPSNDGDLEELEYGEDRDDAQPLQGPYVRPSSWTNITKDDDFVLELIDLYFTWQHPFFLLFSEDRFRADFASGRLANCSSLLVNAILAIGCSYSKRPEALEDPNNPDTIGEHFGNESKRIFERGGKRTITTIQALSVMALRESGFGRDLIGGLYLSMAYRLVCDSSYNRILVPQQVQKNNLDEEAWRITFWGCYNIETMWGFGLGRPSNNNKWTEQIPKPTPTDKTEKALWYPYTGRIPKSALRPVGESMTYEIFNQLVGLCQISQEVIAWLHGNNSLKAATLLAYKAKLDAWRDNLPEHISTVKCGDIPILFYLHGFHRTIFLALFRPFVALPFEPAHNFLSPRQLSDIHSRELVQLMRMFDRSWRFRYGNSILYLYLIPMCNARQIEFPSPEAWEDYQFGVFGMKQMGIGWPFGKIALLSMVEIKDLPEEKKKPTEKLEQLLGELQELSVEKKKEMTHDSSYYVRIVENENGFGRLAPDFIYHWRLEWAKFMAENAEGSAVKRLSVTSLLN